MEIMYFVEFVVHNKSTGNWLKRVSDGGTTSDINEAKRVWGREIDRLYGSADFDFVSVAISNNYGKEILMDTKDVRVIPEPEPQPESNE